ncbi:hypothetical protein [Mycolicibacterium gilvum]|uniref:PhiRv1 phage protein n=1 Tax=Mycolicibacterium gilvum TaxID=1804 RepID=A0A378SNQ5_9MYCO|nr:hypothetical protein [Mycolicibacterium gilvum]MCV7057273.1 hypothetical protein [Mycolicibacterium gilvum]STZ43546.1 phiRv1 phage protein [Mycolicibacterium gilvum]
MTSRALDARNRLASVVRHHPADQPRINEARAALAEAKLADFIERVLGEAPPLTDEQRVRLTELLRPTARRTTRRKALAERLAELDGGDAA